MPKRFAFILLIIQGLLSFLHYLLYKELLILFPLLSGHHTAILVSLLVISVSFLIFSITCHYSDNPLLTAGYYLSSIFLVLVGYSLISLSLALAVFSFSSIRSEILGTIGLGISISLVIYGLVNARIIRTTNLKIKLPNLPGVWKTRSIVMVSDIHLGQVLRKSFAKKVVKKINGENPDLVLIPGDFYDGVHTDFQGLADEFKNLKATLGVYFSSGNHEMFAGYQVCETAIKNSGIKILENQKVEIDGLQIAGLSYRGDPVTSEGETDENVKTRLEKMGLDKNKPSILLKHVPNHLEAVADMGINLQLSGHSHQGQIWPGRHITKKVWKGFDYGFKTLGGLQIYVSSGVGTWGPPMKVFTKSEIIKITFE